MKKVLLAAVGLFFAAQVNAQEFGITAGYLNLTASTSYGDMDVSASESGFYAGVLADFELSESFHLEPAVVYGNANEANTLFIPVLVKYYIETSGFNIQAGPQGTLVLDDLEGSGVKSFGLDLGFGAGYDINENFFLQARYAFELTNRADTDFFGAPDDLKAHINSLFVGVGYKF